MQNILRKAAVCAKTGNPKSTLYLRINQGLFTKPVKISARSVGWPESEVSTINAARIAGKSDEEIRQLVRKLEAARLNAIPGVEKEAA